MQIEGKKLLQEQVSTLKEQGFIYYVTEEGCGTFSILFRDKYTSAFYQTRGVFTVKSLNPETISLRLENKSSQTIKPEIKARELYLGFMGELQISTSKQNFSETVYEYLLKGLEVANGIGIYKVEEVKQGVTKATLLTTSAEDAYNFATKQAKTTKQPVNVQRWHNKLPYQNITIVNGDYKTATVETLTPTQIEDLMGVHGELNDTALEDYREEVASIHAETRYLMRIERGIKDQLDVLHQQSNSSLMYSSVDAAFNEREIEQLEEELKQVRQKIQDLL